VGGRVVAANDFVERKHWTKIKVRLLAELTVDLMHVAAQLFQQTLQAVEHRIQRGLVSREVGAHEVVESGCVAIFGPPELGCLVQSALHPRALRLAILSD